MAARPADDVDPLGARHPPVDDRDVVLIELELVDRVVAAIDGVDVIALVLEPQHENLAQAEVVLGDKDPHVRRSLADGAFEPLTTRVTDPKGRRTTIGLTNTQSL